VRRLCIPPPADGGSGRTCGADGAPGSNSRWSLTRDQEAEQACPDLALDP